MARPANQDRLRQFIDENIRYITAADLPNIKPGDVDGLIKLLDIEYRNPFDQRTRDDVDNPHRFLLKLMRNPEYFPFTCQYLFNIQLYPFQHAILKELWTRPFPMLVGSRGMGKSFLLAMYAMLRALFCQGCKIVIVGSAFRQAKVVFEYCEKLWAGAPVLRDLCGTGKGFANREQGPRRDVDRCELIIGESVIIALPLGDGSKIRGQRANYIIADEFASIPLPVFEKVVRGFGSVNMDPVAVSEREMRIEVLKRLGYWSDAQEHEFREGEQGNQCIVSGTADCEFLHFGQYWRRYKNIIESRGDRKKLGELHGGEDKIDPSFNWRDYSVMRIPVQVLPPGLMSQKMVAAARATVTKAIYDMEYGAVFVTDSDGFYRRSLIEHCVAGRPGNDIRWTFHAQLRGDPGVRHVFAVDPASESDNLTVVILALHGGHRRIVHCWSTNKKAHNERIKYKLTKEQNFNAFVARKLRDLMTAFPCERIECDSQGGGSSIREALADTDKLLPGERPIYEVIDHEKPKGTDGRDGLHILEMVNFADASWTGEANHGLKKDFEDRTCQFPYFDPAIIELATIEDKELGRVVIEDNREIKLHDTLEDVVMEIEELKNELTTIVWTKTPSGRDHWDTPEVKSEGSRKGRLRKDRYSALLMANMAARTIQRAPAQEEYRPQGGFANSLQDSSRTRGGGQLYVGGNGDWISGWVNSQCRKQGVAVRRG